MRIAIKQLEGRNCYVVPVVMITEGVHAGSRGPVYYPREVLANTARLWNGRPVVVMHPDMYSSGVANHPDVFNRQKIGTIFDCRMDGKRLKADAWIDCQRVEKVDPRVLNAIRQQKVMEVSTGLEIEFDSRGGTFNGATYALAAKSLRPDHLAVLPDQKGACSIAAGAGLIRNEGLRQEVLGVPSMAF